MTSRQEAALHTRRFSGDGAGRADVHGESWNLGSRRFFSSRPPLACGFALMRRSPRGASRRLPRATLRARRTVPPAGSCAASTPGCQMTRRLNVAHRHLVARASALECAGRRLPSDRSTPWACAGRSSASPGSAEAVRPRLLPDHLDLADHLVRARLPSAGASAPARLLRRTHGR